MTAQTSLFLFASAISLPTYQQAPFIGADASAMTVSSIRRMQRGHPQALSSKTVLRRSQKV